MDSVAEQEIFTQEVKHRIEQAEDSRILSMFSFMSELATPAAAVTTAAATGLVTDHIQFHVIHLLPLLIFPR